MFGQLLDKHARQGERLLVGHDSFRKMQKQDDASKMVCFPPAIGNTHDRKKNEGSAVMVAF